MTAIQDPIDNPMFEPVQDETRYKIMSKLLDEELLKFTSYIKDDKDRGYIMRIQTTVKAYKHIMEPLMKIDKSIEAEATEAISIWLGQVTEYLEGMMIRKGWRPEQIAVILAGEEKARKKFSMGIFEDPQMKGVEDIKRIQQ